MAKVHFDADRFAAEMEAARPEARAEALRRAEDSRGRAFVMAQDSLFPALVHVMQTYANLRGAGTDEEFLARMLGAFCGALLMNAAANSADPEAFGEEFFGHLAASFDTRNHLSNVKLEVTGVRGGAV